MRRPGLRLLVAATALVAVGYVVDQAPPEPAEPDSAIMLRAAATQAPPPAVVARCRATCHVVVSPSQPDNGVDPEDQEEDYAP